MAGVFRDITMTWKGEDYTFTPSNRLLRRIEVKGDLSIANVAHGAASGQAKLSLVAFIAAEFLKEGGARVTEDEVYAALMGVGDSAGLSILDAILTAIMPIDAGKKEEAPSE